MDYAVGMALWQRINATMALLYHVAARADLAFAQTHGGNSRERSKSNQNRWGGGYSVVAKRTALVCTRLRKLVKSACKQRLGDADAMRAILTSDGIEIGDVYREAGVVVAEAKAALKRERKLLHGRKRKQYILQGEASVFSHKSVSKERRRQIFPGTSKPVTRSGAACGTASHTRRTGAVGGGGRGWRRTRGEEQGAG